MAGSDTRDRIVEAARSLFWEQGYEATSLAQIAERSSAMTGSIYHFFKTKAEILDAVVHHYDAALFHWLVDPVFARSDDPRERVFGIIASYREFLVETGFSLGCPVGGLAMEIASSHPAARAKIGSIFDALTDVIEGCLDAFEPPLADPPGSRSLAALVMTVIEGGIVQARAQGSVEPFDRSVASLADYFDRLERSTAAR